MLLQVRLGDLVGCQRTGALLLASRAFLAMGEGCPPLAGALIQAVAWFRARTPPDWNLDCAMQQSRDEPVSDPPNSLMSIRRSALPYLGALDHAKLSYVVNILGAHTKQTPRSDAPLPPTDANALQDCGVVSMLICPACELMRLAKPRAANCANMEFAAWRSCCNKHGRLHDTFHFPIVKLRDLFRARKLGIASQGCKYVVRPGLVSSWRGSVLYFALYEDVLRAGRLENRLSLQRDRASVEIASLFPSLALILMKQLDVYGQLHRYDWQVYCWLPVESRFYIATVAEAVLGCWLDEGSRRTRSSRRRGRSLAVAHGFWPLWENIEMTGRVAVFGTLPSEHDLRAFAALLGTRRAAALLNRLLRRRSGHNDGFQVFRLPRDAARLIGREKHGVFSDKPAAHSDPPVYCWN